MNIPFLCNKLARFTLKRLLGLVFLVSLSTYVLSLRAADNTIELVKACVVIGEPNPTPIIRQKISRCLGWKSQAGASVCQGSYQPIIVEPIENGEVQLAADKVSLYLQGRSVLSGRVEVKQTDRVVTADTAYVYRNGQSREITKIELVGEVHYREPNKLMIAKKATINPHDKTGVVEDVLYRFNAQRSGSFFPSWGQAALIKRFANQNYQLQQATYSTCAPQDNAWRIQAQRIDLDNAQGNGHARHAKLLIGDVPIFYSPYLSFPISKKRKSGFLFPTIGHSNIGGYDASFPYYLNLAPNYDATLTPHPYSLRGVMVDGIFRYLGSSSQGRFEGSFLNNDRVFNKFIKHNAAYYPTLQDSSTNRWSISAVNQASLTSNLRFRMNYQQVSDDYYLQDFTNNLALLTERQLPREAELTYNSENWMISSLVQSYQTLQPINESIIDDIYQRLPQLRAQGTYDNLLFNSKLSILGELDYFRWPNSLNPMPNGPRYYLNPIWSLPTERPAGYFTPSFEVIHSYYDLTNYYSYANNGRATFQHTIPRASVDSGLYFDRHLNLFNSSFTQTLEPRLFYLFTPYTNQSATPVFDSSYMIFSFDQLFRTNRFSGLDRVGDANQLSYAVTTRWMADNDGSEKAAFSIGQALYFSDRKVKLCQSPTGQCLDNPLMLGYLSPTSTLSPIASRASYHFNPYWGVSADYIWDSKRATTNNAALNFHYQPTTTQLVNVGYTYLVVGDVTQLAEQVVVDPLHQVTFSFAWPLNEKWSTVAAYDYNISKGYEMLRLFGVQYDSCCWAMRLLGGRSFQSLNNTLQPQYNNNIYFQVLLKGLGSLGTSDPGSFLRTYLPGYADSFHKM